MRKLGTDTLNHIQQLIATTDTRTQTASHSKLNKKASHSKLNQQEKIDTKKKTPLKQSQHNAPLKSTSQKQYKNIHGYQPLQKQNKIMERQLKVIYKELDFQQSHQIQNQISVFLNSKNPRPPIHERAQLILEEREALLQQKRKQMKRLKQQREQQEIQKILADAPPKKVINKSQASELTERLYKQHYSKLNRLNQQKMQRLKKQTEAYRQKPQINPTSKVLYKAKQDKNNLQNDVISRFEKYNKQKVQKQAQMQKSYEQRYFPFKPVINEQSKLLTSARTDRGDLSERKRCNSCVRLKSSKSNLTMTYSPKRSPLKKTFKRQSPLKISQFH